MRVSLFKDSRPSFLGALDAAKIAYNETTGVPGTVMASGSTIFVEITAAVAAPLAAVVVMWIRARASRKVILTMKENTVVHIEGYTAEQVQELLSRVDSLTAIDTRPTDDE